MNDFKLKLKELNLEYNFHKNKIFQLGENSLKLIFETFPKVKSIEIIGTTPSFNDGDIIRHQQHSDFLLNKDNIYSLIEGEIKSSLSKENLELIFELVNSDPVIFYLNEAYGTNFNLKITYKKNKLLMEMNNDY